MRYLGSGDRKDVAIHIKIRACSVPTHPRNAARRWYGMVRGRLNESATVRSGMASTTLARAEKSAAGQIGLAAFYWLALAAVPTVGEPRLERGDSG